GQPPNEAQRRESPPSNARRTFVGKLIPRYQLSAGVAYEIRTRVTAVKEDHTRLGTAPPATAGASPPPPSPGRSIGPAPPPAARRSAQTHPRRQGCGPAGPSPGPWVRAAGGRRGRSRSCG